MKIQVPTHINDITLEQYQKFALINTEEQDKEFFMFKTIEIFCGVDISLVSKMRLKDAESISNEVIEVLNSNVPFTNRFELEGVKYGFIPDLQQISLGEFIDLEEGLADSKSFHKAAATMFRPIVKEAGELYTIDGYEASTEMHHIMKQAPLGVISAAIVFFLQYRERVTNGFGGLFTGEAGGDDDYSRESQFSKKYGWFNSLYALCGGDATKFKAVTELNHLEALLFLEFEKEKAEIERAQYRRNR